jgi:hypothetical protein
MKTTIPQLHDMIRNHILDGGIVISQYRTESYEPVVDVDLLDDYGDGHKLLFYSSNSRPDYNLCLCERNDSLELTPEGVIARFGPGPHDRVIVRFMMPVSALAVFESYKPQP